MHAALLRKCPSDKTSICLSSWVMYPGLRCRRKRGGGKGGKSHFLSINYIPVLSSHLPRLTPSVPKDYVLLQWHSIGTCSCTATILCSLKFPLVVIQMDKNKKMLSFSKISVIVYIAGWIFGKIKMHYKPSLLRRTETFRVFLFFSRFVFLIIWFFSYYQLGGWKFQHYW